MKREHEARIQLIYSANGVKNSLPILMSFPIGAHVPVIDVRQVEGHVQTFRREFNTFLMQLVRAGVRVLHLHPATPLWASVEIGRMLLLKTFEGIHVWEWQAPAWKQALRLK